MFTPLSTSSREPCSAWRSVTGCGFRLARAWLLECDRGDFGLVALRGLLARIRVIEGALSIALRLEQVADRGELHAAEDLLATAPSGGIGVIVRDEELAEP